MWLYITGGRVHMYTRHLDFILTLSWRQKSSGWFVKHLYRKKQQTFIHVCTCNWCKCYWRDKYLRLLEQITLSSLPPEARVGHSNLVALHSTQVYKILVQKHPVRRSILGSRILYLYYRLNTLNTWHTVYCSGKLLFGQTLMDGMRRYLYDKSWGPLAPSKSPSSSATTCTKEDVYYWVL